MTAAAADNTGRDNDDEALIVCRCYTKARRHPKVIGTVQGHKLPFGLILWTAQLGVIVASFCAVMWTRGLWGQVFTAGPVQLVIVLGVPIGLGCAVRYARLEGRTPVQMIAGVGAYLARRSRGVVVGGRPVREGRRRAVLGGRVYVQRKWAAR